MISSTTGFASDRAGRYLVQLCKHFAHKVPAEYDESRGRVDFPWGVCRLQADGGRLAVTCEAADTEALKRVEAVVTDHVERFAWREKPRMDWQPG